jgi:RsiW-degrading membrane proteinase PrsW (M82 family)
MAFQRPPRPGGGGRNLSRSTIFPLLANRSALVSKGHLLPILATIIAGCSLLGAGSGVFAWPRLVDNDELNIAFQVYWILALYIAFMANFYIYSICGRAKPWWVIAALFAGMAALLWPPHLLFDVFAWPFYTVLPGRFANSSVVSLRILAAFFGPGLCEELFKALPLFALAWIGLNRKGALARTIGITEPLDGILFGVAVASGFALSETLGQYVVGSVNDALEPFTKAVGVEHGIELGAGTAAFQGLILLLSRGLAFIAGHLAYTGVFGYFIGLAVLRPAIWKQLLALGWGTAAFLHGAWDAVGSIDSQSPITILLVFVALATLSYACLAAAILKARQLSPTRAWNFATVVRSGSPPPAAAGAAGAASAHGFDAPRNAGAAPKPSGSSRTPSPAVTVPLIITIGPLTRAVTRDLRIDAQMLGSAGAEMEPGPIARIDVDARDGGFGLVNLTQRSWAVMLPGGQTINLVAGRAVRLAPGVVIDFGGIKGAVTAA